MTRTLEAPTPQGRSASAEHDDPQYLRGPVLRGVLPLLAVPLIVLAGVLTLAALGIGITPVASALAVGGYALLAVGGLVLYRRRHPRARAVVNWRHVAGGVVTAVVLVGAVAVAQWLQPTTASRFVTLQSTTSAIYTDGALQTPASGAVDLGWQLRGYGVDLIADPVVTVTVDGVPPVDLSVLPAAAPDAVPDMQGNGSTSGLSGRVSFSAPAAPGRYRVVVTVADQADPAGAQELVLQLVVTA